LSRGGNRCQFEGARFFVEGINMRMRFLFAAVAALALAAATFALAASIAFAAEPAPAGPRQVAAEVAKAVDEIFYDAARARTIADGLRANAAKGDYDRFTNPLDLATALTSYLRPFDGHFMVVYRPNGDDLPGGPRPRGQGPGATPAPNLALARQNYGFVHTEMLPGGVGYIEVNQFAPIDARVPADPARKAVDAALQTVAGARAIVIDLRSSRGGAPSMVAYLASYFVPAGANIFNTFYSRGGTASEAPVADPRRPAPFGYAALHPGQRRHRLRVGVVSLHTPGGQARGDRGRTHERACQSRRFHPRRGRLYRVRLRRLAEEPDHRQELGRNGRRARRRGRLRRRARPCAGLGACAPAHDRARR
jgi:hypothetical protein